MCRHSHHGRHPVHEHIHRDNTAPLPDPGQS
jgi:hypothetical protein